MEKLKITSKTIDCTIQFTTGLYICLENSNKKIIWDPSSFLPDPSHILKKGQSYNAQVIFVLRQISKVKLMIPYQIIINSTTFTNIRNFNKDGTPKENASRDKV